MINDTPSGNAMIQSIGDSGRTTTIQPRDPAGSVFDTSASAANPADRTNGVGTDSTVNYTPSDFPAPGTTTNAPSDVALFHEMTHAEHNAHGTNQRNTPRTDGFTNDEEFNTIQAENQYRDERGPWPGRPDDYHRNDGSFAGF